MEQSKIDRINELSKKRKEQGLTEEEAAERTALHREYVQAVLGNLEHHLQHTVVVDEHGNRRKLRKKEESET